MKTYLRNEGHGPQGTGRFAANLAQSYCGPKNFDPAITTIQTAA
jgi:hypothetical protein